MKTKLLLILSIAIFTIASAQYTKLLDFEGTVNGQFPNGSFISDGTFLYGITYSGGTSTKGTAFKIKSDGAAYSKLIDFTGVVNGQHPSGSFISDGIFLYGMTYSGGINDMGTLFKIKPDGTGYSDLLDFAGAANGKNPNGDLISDGIFLYGMTFYGGTNDSGVVFKIKPDGTGYSKLLDFDGAVNGRNPYGSLIFDGTFLYGMTKYGGTNGMGVIFKIKPDGTGYFKLLDFAGVTNGKYPYGSLISDGAFLYGMTAGGGTNNKGTVFKINLDGSGYSKLLDFTGTANGGNPNGSLISDGAFLYGMTAFGGTNNKGVIFKIKFDGSGYSNLLDFAGSTNGGNPYGSLISDGTFLYGMTYGGGVNGLGTIFKYQYCSAITDSLTITSPICGNNNGSVTVTPSGGSGAYSFLWNNGSTTSFVSGLSGDPTDTLIVIITDSIGCSHTDTAIVSCLSGISLPSNRTTWISVDPNPFSSETTIRTDQFFNDATLRIYNIYGQQVKQIKMMRGQPIILFREHLPSGLYFIRLTRENKILSSQKLIITDQ